jgi:hypothetical protein
MEMTDGFAAAVTVSIPIFALAAGAEARSIRDRLKRPDEQWERDFARYDAKHELDPSGSAAEVLAYFKGLPKLGRLHTIERAIALAGAVVWLVVFVLLTIAEVMSLLWLADGEPHGHSGLATFSLVSIALAMVALIVAPALYLALPLLLSIDLIPVGLTKAVLPKATSERGRSFIRNMFAELEGAVERAAESAESADRPAANAGADTDGSTVGSAGPAADGSSA